MNELIKIYDHENRKLVNARDLHNFLGVISRFNDWIKNRIVKYDFIEDEDYSTLTKYLVSGGRQLEYGLTIEMAKELCMLENNDKGSEARKYFIKVEKKYKDQHEIPQTYSQALMLAAKQAEKLELQEKNIKELEPKAEFYDTVTNSKTAIDIGRAAKVLDVGMGRTKLFQWLRAHRILMKNNAPYQKYIDLGYFRVIESKFQKPDGSTHISIKTLVYQKGLDFIRKKLS